MGLGFRVGSWIGKRPGDPLCEKRYMGGYHNYGPFLDPYYNTAPNIYGTQKRDHNFDNHPHHGCK